MTYRPEIRYDDEYVLGRNWLSDTVALCCGEYMWVNMYPYYYDINRSYDYLDAENNWLSYSDYAMDTTYNSYGSYGISYSFQNFVYYADSLYDYGDNNSWDMRLTFPADTDCELFFIQLSYFNDKKVHIRYRRNVVRNTNTTQEIKCKYELIDNDRSGRAAFTFLTELSDSVVYQIMDNDGHWSENQKFTKYLYFDTVPNYLYIKSYYNGCLSAYNYWCGYPQPMPRIHDTIVEYVHDTTISFVHDTIYIFRTDTIYLQTAINAKSVNNLNIFPNPTTQFVTVDAESEFSYTLTNTAGKVLRKEENQASYLIDMSEYPSGTYMLTTSDGATHKIVKK